MAVRAARRSDMGRRRLGRNEMRYVTINKIAEGAFAKIAADLWLRGADLFSKRTLNSKFDFRFGGGLLAADCRASARQPFARDFFASDFSALGAVFLGGRIGASPWLVPLSALAVVARLFFKASNKSMI